MGVRQRVTPEPSGGVHVCQFFDSDESRVEAVAAFIADGLRQGDRTIVIARPVQWAALSERLEAVNLPVHRELGRGTLIVKDATDTLHRLSPGGSVAAEAFTATVGATLRRVAALGPVRAYGEMVDILAQRGDFEEAIRLEALWNHLLADVPFSLLCGYAAASFVAPASHRALRRICAEHGDVHRNPQDALANWLVTTAHHPVAASSSISH
jgi:hypothetical protein